LINKSCKLLKEWVEVTNHNHQAIVLYLETRQQKSPLQLTPYQIVRLQILYILLIVDL